MKIEKFKSEEKYETRHRASTC